MAVPGRLAEMSKNEQCEGVSEIFCQPCADEGKQSPVAGFCVDCRDYLCETCSTSHRRAWALRHHVLQDMKPMPRHLFQKKTPEMTFDECSKHVHKKLEFYCRYHDSFGCGTCITLNHRQCVVEKMMPKNKHQMKASDMIGDIYNDHKGASMPLSEHEEDICFSKDDLNTKCKKYGRKSKEVRELCNRINENLMECNSTVFKRVWAAYRHNVENEIVFVIECTNINDATKVISQSHFNTLDIEYRDVNASSQEDVDITFSDERMNKQLTSIELDKLKNSFFERSEELLDKHQHLSIIRACSVKSKQYGTKMQTILQETCVVFYVHVKGLIPIEEDPFPETFNDLPTDVREGEFELYGKTAKVYHQHIIMGLQISGEWPKSGTLGPIVDLPDNKVGLITSAHVVLSEYWHNLLKKNGTLQGSDLKAYQPHIEDRHPPFGGISKGAYRRGSNAAAGLEVVLIDIEDPERYPNTGLFPDGDFTKAGFETADPMRFVSGKICPDPDEVRRMTLIKYGCETDITCGQFDLSGPSVCRNMVFDKDISVRLYNQIQVTGQAHRPFALPGDSGALVFSAYKGQQNDLRAVGILTGGHSDGCVCFVTPIKDVLGAFGYNLCLKKFSHQQPNDATCQNVPMDTN